MFRPTGIRGLFLFTLILMTIALPVRAEQILVAVASNFSAPAREIAAEFESVSTHRVTLVFGSTGRHYAQILNGGPFTVFLAADVKRPRRLEEDGQAVAGSRFTYAEGRIALWSDRTAYVDSAGAVLRDGDFAHLSLANPQLAPYGLAAQEVLEALGLWPSLQDRVVRGENIAQALQFILSGNAELGFVALSQLLSPEQRPEGSVWVVPQSLYAPIEQQAILLEESAAGQAFLDFLRGDRARRIITRYGYDVPAKGDTDRAE